MKKTILLISIIALWTMLFCITFMIKAVYFEAKGDVAQCGRLMLYAMGFLLLSGVLVELKRFLKRIEKNKSNDFPI